MNISGLELSVFDPQLLDHGCVQEVNADEQRYQKMAFRIQYKFCCLILPIILDLLLISQTQGVVSLVAEAKAFSRPFGS